MQVGCWQISGAYTLLFNYKPQGRRFLATGSFIGGKDLLFLLGVPFPSTGATIQVGNLTVHSGGNTWHNSIQRRRR
jgi:hypothetical protein